jgi:hypothetical protein
VLFACGDNRLIARDVLEDAPIADAAIDGRDAPPDVALVPDLSPVAASMMTHTITIDTFTGSSCEFIEQCIGGVGQRRLLKFDTVTQNLGTADLVVGAPPAMGVSEPPFEWSPCHNHHHFSGFASYELLDGTGVVVSGHKQAFCILDTTRVTPGAPSQGYTCVNQGMSKGWADVYSRGLPCQWVDITDVAAGTYTLRVRINPDGALIESDYSNNEFTRSITL